MKAIFSITLSCLLCLSLCSCNFYSADPDSLLSPPQLTGELKHIQDALNDTVEGKYDLKYPASGDLKSAVVTEDVDGDGKDEAFVFYAAKSEEQTNMHINAICKKGKKYKSTDDQKITASGIEKINFCDFDGDGKEEIIVGWEIYANSEKQLQVFGYTNGRLLLRHSARYTEFICCDLDENGENELIVQDLDTQKGTNTASVYKFDSKGVSQTAGCKMDGNAETVEKFRLSVLSGEQPAIYIDEIKGIGAITEVLFMKKGELINPLLEIEKSGENVKTLRAETTHYADIDNDGIIEIPIESKIPSANKRNDEDFFYTRWCTFDGEILNVKKVTVINALDGYSLTVPAKWTNAIALSRDEENRIRTVYRYDFKNKKTAEPLLTIRVFDKNKFSKETGGNYIKLSERGDEIYAGQIHKSKLSVEETELKEMFELQ